ncbi:LPXTG cell wall anchor domain-containing protein [Enterococcus sp. DIV0756]|uniref:LPXTG cell wall anchor domain-containing protein n=1 Tax=Enterococcus sp. DIV0756 TaxID=2774636 RepID=UPI003F25A7C1
MNTTKQKIALYFGLTLSLIGASPLRAFCSTTETSEPATQKYVINGVLYESDKTNDANHLNLHNNNSESLNLYRDGKRWYSDNGEVTPEPYTEPTTVPESTSFSDVSTKIPTNTTTSSVETLEGSSTTLEPIIKDGSVNKSETRVIETLPNNESPAKQVIQDTEKVPELKNESATLPEKNSTGVTTEKPYADSTENLNVSHPTQSETPVFSDNKRLPKTGSSTHQSLFLTISGIILFLSALFLFKKTNEPFVGGKK